MNKIRKSFFILGLLLSVSGSLIYAGDYDFDNTNDEEFDEILHMPDLATRATTNCEALLFLCSINLNEVLAQNFFRRTNSLNKRPIETLPIFWLAPDATANLNWNFRVHLFFNENGYLHLSPEGYKLGQNYIQLNEEFFEALDLKEFQDKLPSLFLIDPAKIQERRLGFMFQMFKNWQKASLEALFGLMYDERNYYFTPEEQAAITDQFGAENTSNNVSNNTLLEHALSDKIGISDLQLKFRIPICDDQEQGVYVNAGPMVTVPTAFALKNGIFGSNFVDKSHRPTFNMKRLLDDAKADNLTGASQIVIPVLINSIDRLSEALLQTPLGNGGHWGLGALIEPQYLYSEHVRVPVSAWVEYLIPAYEPRFYIQKKDPASFADICTIGIDQEACARKLNFLDEQAINTIYLEREMVKVHPGLTGEIQIAPEFKIKECVFVLGYDFWFKQQEHLEQFQTAHRATIATLNRSFNRPFRAYQQTVFSKIGYRAMRPTYDWTLDISGQKTLSSYGIGKGWSLALAFELNY